MLICHCCFCVQATSNSHHCRFWHLEGWSGLTNGDIGTDRFQRWKQQYIKDIQDGDFLGNGEACVLSEAYNVCICVWYFDEKSRLASLLRPCWLPSQANAAMPPPCVHLLWLNENHFEPTKISPHFRPVFPSEFIFDVLAYIFWHI